MKLPTEDHLAKESIPAQTPDVCLPHIRAHYPSLRPAERKVADLILAHPAEASALSSVELARRSGVSDATVVKFSQHLGFLGFAQLKLALVRELATVPAGAFGEVTPGDSLQEIKDKVFHANAQALTDTARVLDPAKLEAAVSRILKARRVDFFGVGASGVVALDAQLKFMRIGIDSGCYPDAHVQATRAALLQPGDVAVVITHSGRTRDALEVLKLARQAGAATICVTNHPTSPAALLAEVVLLTSAQETDLRSGALASRLAQLTVVDCLFMGVAIRRHRKALDYLARTRAALAGRRA